MVERATMKSEDVFLEGTVRGPRDLGATHREPAFSCEWKQQKHMGGYGWVV